MTSEPAPPTRDFTKTLRDVKERSASEIRAPGDGIREKHEALRALGLERHCAELDALGYTVVHNVAPPAFIESLASATLEIFEEARGRHVDFDTGEEGLFQIIPLMLAKGHIFEEVAMNPRVLALIDHLLGSSCRISDFHAMLKGRGTAKTDLHCDSAFMPDPLPPYAQVANANWLLSDYSSENGALSFVPGSHKLCRHPTAADRDLETVAIEAPRGSVVVFHGNSWHGTHARTQPGLRMNLVCYFARMYVQPHADYSRILSREVIDRNPARFNQLVGGHVPWGWSNHAEFTAGMLKLADVGVAGRFQHT